MGQSYSVVDIPSSIPLETKTIAMANSFVVRSGNLYSGPFVSSGNLSDINCDTLVHAVTVCVRSNMY